jgi:N-acetylgalactosamine-N,N'-diacetylbacillosaminyl-diphospho-undecaprenol 4-alpha-N-acetylgalactosaminyltransferase
VHLFLFEDLIHFSIPKEVKVHIIGPKYSNLFTKIFGFVIIPFRYHSILKNLKINTSLSFLTRPNIINGIIKIFNPNIKIILSERCFPSIAYKSNLFRYYLYKCLIPLFYNKADAVFSNSIFINKDLRSSFNVKAPLKVIYNPIEDVDEKLFLNKDQKIIDIIWVGKLIDIKNPSLLIEAIHKTGNQIKTTFLGEGELLEKLKNKTNGFNITFEGKVSNVNDYINKSKVLILTSNSEGFPNVILEGMSYGLPIIATNCKSGPLELLNDGEHIEIPNGGYKIAKYGILINVNDSNGLSRAIKKVLNDNELYEYLSKKSLQRSKDYSTPKIYTQLKKLIS